MVDTGVRDGFVPRSLEYFEKMYDELAPKHMKLLMAYYEEKEYEQIVAYLEELKEYRKNDKNK